MMEREQIVAAVIAAAGGTLTSRVRLQKTVYLLDRLGLNTGFSFDYYHYGPFSRDLENATSDAKALRVISEEIGHRQSDNAAYSVFTQQGEPDPQAYGSLGSERAGQIARLCAETNVTVLELAATIDWLYTAEHCADWKREIIKRKGIKTEKGRLDKAVELLTRLGLKPPRIAAAA